MYEDTKYIPNDLTFLTLVLKYVKAIAYIKKTYYLCINKLRKELIMYLKKIAKNIIKICLPSLNEKAIKKDDLSIELINSVSNIKNRYIKEDVEDIIMFMDSILNSSNSFKNASEVITLTNETIHDILNEVERIN